MDITALRAFFLWCTIINGGLLIFSSFFCAFLGDLSYKMSSKFFPMPRQTFEIILFSFIAAYKLFVIAFNLVPYIALLIIS